MPRTTIGDAAGRYELSFPGRNNPLVAYPECGADDRLSMWERAEAGDRVAQNLVGMMLSFNQDTDTARANGEFPDRCDWNAAKHWFELSAANGYWAAMNNLAVMMIHGYGVDRDLPGAVALLERAGNQMKRKPLERLAALLEAGEGIPRDPERATYLRELAAACDDV